MSKLIPLHGKYGKGKFAIVDDQDYDYLNQFRWHLAHGYVVRSAKNALGQPRNLGMHIEIMNPPPGMEVDHIDGDKLRHTRDKLRIVTREQNGWNKRNFSRNKSGFKGVSWLERDQHYTVWICYKGKNRYVGSFHDILEAAAAYNDAAIKYYGEYAALNVLPDGYVRSGGRSGRARRDGRSPYIGAIWNSRPKKYAATIKFEGLRIHLGFYDDDADAGYAYDQAALQLLGDKARLNFLVGPYIPWPKDDDSLIDDDLDAGV